MERSSGPPPSCCIYEKGASLHLVFLLPSAIACCSFLRHWWILSLPWSIKRSVKTLGREFSFHQNKMLNCFCFRGLCFVPYQQVCATHWRYWHTVLAYLELITLRFSMCPSKGWHTLSLQFQRSPCLLAQSAVYQTENATLLLQELHERCLGRLLQLCSFVGCFEPSCLQQILRDLKSAG